MRKPLVTSIVILLVTASTLGLSLKTYAEEGEEPAWIVSHQVVGNLVVAPDSSLPQWAQAHHGHADSLDGVEIELMSVHNGTYIVFLLERSFNQSLAMAGVAMFFNGTAFDSASAIWGWVAGQNDSTDASVVSVGDLSSETLTVVFGRSMVPALNSEARLAIGELYAEAVRVTSWNNSTRPTGLDYADVPPMGLELLPNIDLYPTTPIVYSAVILIATLGFILLEVRRYRR